MKLERPALWKFNPADWPEIQRLLDADDRRDWDEANRVEARLKEIYKKNIHVLPDGATGGRLASASASSITGFDERQPFGCNRRFWFGDYAGILGGGTSATDLGDVIHKQIEHYLKTGQDALGKEARAGLGNVNVIREKFPVLQIERWIEALVLDGVNIRGRVDVTGRTVGSPLITGVVDWKSSSDVSKWGKTPYQLTKDPQMLIYRQDAENLGCDENLWMAHVYFGTKKRESEIVPTRINRQQLADGIGDIVLTLRRMKEVARITDVAEVPADRKKCNEGSKYQCPYFDICPKSQTTAVQGANLMASLFSKFGSPSAAPANPPAVIVPPPPPAEPAKKVYKQIQDVAPEAPAVDPVAALKAQIAELEAKAAVKAFQTGGVLPPDAPKSDPKLAADPVEGFDPLPKPLKQAGAMPAAPEIHNTATVPPAPEEKKKPGRPPGAKNKATLEGATPGEPSFEIIEVTVSHGATVKADPDPKSYEFVRVEITMKAAVRNMDPQAARQQLGDAAQAALVAELSRLRPDGKS